MHQPKTGDRLNLYSAKSPNAKRNITESTKGYRVIIGKSCKIVVPIFALNCMYIQAIVQEMQVVTQIVLLQQQITKSLLGRMQVLKQLQTSNQSVSIFQ